MSKRKQRRHKARPASKRVSISPDWNSEPSGPLFHYTSAAGLIGIVKDQVLWATHANYLNDTAELQIISRLLTPQISNEFRQIVPRLVDLNAFKPGLLQNFGESLYDTEAINVCRAVMRTIEKVSPMYVVSFCMHDAGSEESEHGLLSQWRGCGLGGFAIEFDPVELDKLTQLENAQRSVQMIGTRKVAYRDHEAKAELKRFEGLGRATLGNAFRAAAPTLAARPDVAEIIGNQPLEDFVRPFLKAVPFLKTPRFESEKEYRLVASATRPKNVSEDTRAPINVHFREGASGAIIPYIKLFETLGTKLPIRKIIVGPHRDQENQLQRGAIVT